MLDLFERCLAATYIHTAEGGDYAVEVDGNILYLLFEWSDGREDWKNNFDFPAVPYKDMRPKWRCHRGFLRVWKAMQDEAVKAVEAALAAHHEIWKIVCVGYSHGAALAVLATEDMEFRFGNRYKVSGCGFGAPRVIWGCIPGEVKYRLRHFVTVRNSPDIVTHVPPMWLGYRNAGKLVKVGRFGGYGAITAHTAATYRAELKKRS